MPWATLIALIEPHYPKASKKGGRPPYPLATLLRIHLLQQWYSLSDPAMEESLIETPTMRRFAGIELISDRIPDETTILTFRHLLEKRMTCSAVWRIRFMVKSPAQSGRMRTLIHRGPISRGHVSGTPDHVSFRGRTSKDDIGHGPASPNSVWLWAMGFGSGRGCFGREGVQSCTGTFPETGGNGRRSRRG